MVDRLGQPALTIEQLSEVGVSDGRVGVDRKGVGPQPPRVVPDLDLVPGEDSQRDDDTRGNAGNPPRRRCPRRARGEAPAGQQAGADQDRPSGGGEIGVSIGRNLRAVLSDAEHRQEDDHVRQPRRRQAGASTAECQSDRRDGKHPAVTHDERRRRGIHRLRQHVERREVKGHDRLPEVEAQSVRRDLEPVQRAQVSHGDHAAVRELRHEGDRRRGSGQQDEWDLLHVDPPCGRPRPSEGPAEASERIDLQDQQHDGKAHRHRFREEGTGEQRH